MDILADLTSDTSGPLHILEDNYQDIMDNIDKKIEYEEARIRRMELNLRDRYAALESMLNYYESVNTSLGQQIASIKSE